jgi:probable selenium-dependent hydroxylase accessory protein YqeC
MPLALELSAEKPSLAAGLLDADLDPVKARGGKLLSQPEPELSGDMLRQKLRARIGKREQDDIPSRQNQPLILVANLNHAPTPPNLEQGMAQLDQGPMIELVANLLDHRLERREVEHDSGPVEIAFDHDGDLVIVAVERLSFAVGEDEKVGGGEVEVVFVHFDAEAPRHERTLTKSGGGCKESADGLSQEGMALTEAVGLGHGEMVALIGAGGKTTTLYRLAMEFWQAGGKVLATTTTKIFKPAKPHVHKLYVVQGLNALLEVIAKIGEPIVIGAGSSLEATKLVGLPPEWLDAVSERGGLEVILVEADGAASRALKVPADHEPVVPARSSVAVWVMGVKVLGRPLTSQWVHRAERAADLLGVEPGSAVTEELILRLVRHPGGCLKGIPAGCRKVAIINQADTADEVKQAAALGRSLLEHDLERVVVTSYLGDDPVKEVLSS